MPDILLKIVLSLVGAVVLLVGLAGVIIPGMPGIPVVWVVVALDYWLLGFLDLSGIAMLVLSVLTAATLVIDYLATLLGVKKKGGSFLGMLGTFLGLIIGLVVFNIPGMLIGCFLGALAGELLHGKTRSQASSIALGSLLGYAAAAAFKLATWIIYAIVIFYNIFARGGVL